VPPVPHIVVEMVKIYFQIFSPVVIILVRLSTRQ
jgi:hypothetical protein